MKGAEIIEHVYNPKDAPDDFQEVQIMMHASDEKLQIILNCEADMKKLDIESVLRYLERAILQARRISLYQECDVFIGQKKVQLSEDLQVLGVG